MSRHVQLPYVPSQEKVAKELWLVILMWAWQSRVSGPYINLFNFVGQLNVIARTITANDFEKIELVQTYTKYLNLTFDLKYC